MKRKISIRKILATTCWLIAGAGMLVLLGAAMNSKKLNRCNGFEIDINGSEKGQWFIDKADVVKIITKNGTSEIKGTPLRSFDLRSLEIAVKKEAWIKSAELFFDNNNVLQVRIIEREPVARIFTAGGSSFYIDTACKKLPLSEKMSARVPVFTGFPSELTKRNRADSVLLRAIRDLSLFIQKDVFLDAQIAQTDINLSREFEMIPVVGNHTIEFGNTDNYQNKFRRLKIFYKMILAKTGMDVYTRIKLQFDNEVVGVKKPGYKNKADSLQAERHIQEMIMSREADEVNPADSSITQEVVNPVSTETPLPEKSAVEVRQDEKPVDKPKALPSKAGANQSNPKKTNIPKAVMPKKA
jgi:cell division protein FtsQ